MDTFRSVEVVRMTKFKMDDLVIKNANFVCCDEAQQEDCR